MIFSLIVLMSTLTPGVHVHTEVQAFGQSGTLQIGATQERAALSVVCSEEGSGELSILLNVPGANARKDFDYDDFEGPDAAASGKALSHIAWITTSGTTEITSVATGSYVPTPQSRSCLASVSCRTNARSQRGC